MSKVFYQLTIDINKQWHPAIDVLLGVSETKGKEFWCYEIIVEDNPIKINEQTVLLHFMNILENKYSDLEAMEIQRSDIIIYVIYEYNNECNMEFLPEEMMLMGKNGIVLAISCYQT